ncbi:MAG: uridine kinase [Oligoflexia bacterium]|nr:uridine kinase [Oligoflexia bacterium]
MYLIGIAGGSGSGKTTFAEKIMQRLPAPKVSLVQMDNYYLDKQPSENFLGDQANFDSPLAFDWDLFRKHLALLKRGKSINMPIYDFTLSRRSKKKMRVGPCKVVIVEGILTLWDEKIRSQLDLKIYIKVEADIRFTRRLHRDIASRNRHLDDIIEQYYKTVRPMHLKYTQPTQQFADLIVGEQHDVAVDVFVHETLMRIRAQK